MKTPYFPAHYRLGDKLGWLLLRAFSIGVLLFLLLPIFVIVPLSFSSGSFLAYPLPGWSLQWYRELLASPEWARAARNSFIVAPLACTVLGHHAGHAGGHGAGAHPLHGPGPGQRLADCAHGGAHRGRGRQHLPVLRASACRKPTWVWCWYTLRWARRLW